MKDKDLFITYIRDKQTKNTVTRYYGKTKEQSLQSTINFLKNMQKQKQCITVIQLPEQKWENTR